MNSRMRNKYLLRSVLLSGALLVFTPEEKAAGQSIDYVDKEIENQYESFSVLPPIISERLKQNASYETSTDLSLYEILEMAFELHNNNKIVEANEVYNFLQEYSDIDEDLKTILKELSEEAEKGNDLNYDHFSDYDFTGLKEIIIIEELISPVSIDSIDENVIHNKDSSKKDPTAEEPLASIIEDKETFTSDKDEEDGVGSKSQKENKDEEDVAVSKSENENKEEALDQSDSLKFEPAENKKADEAGLSQLNATEANLSSLSVTSQRVSSANDYYHASISSSTAAGAWDYAIKGYNNYPNDPLLKEAIEAAAVRMMNWAKTLESRGDLTGAVKFYDTVLSSPWLSNGIRQRATDAKKQVQSKAYEQRVNNAYTASYQAPTADRAWSAAMSMYQEFPEESKTREAIEAAAVRMMNWAKTLESRGDLTGAVKFYDTVLSSPWLSNGIRQRATDAKKQVQSKAYEQRVNNAYTASRQAPTADRAWSAAMSMYQEFSEESKTREAIEAAAVRMINWGRTLSSRGRNIDALEFYKEVEKAPWLSGATRTVVNNEIKEVRELIQKADRLYKESIDAVTADDAWEKALKGYMTFPADTRFNKALDLASKRMSNWAQVLETRGDYLLAIDFYTSILDSPWLPSGRRTEVTNLKSKAEKVLKSADYIYNESIQTLDVNIAWEKALEGLSKFGTDKRFEQALAIAADRVLEEGMALHRLGEFSKAVEYYTLLANGPSQLYEGKETAEKLSVLAKNNQRPSQAVYQISQYTSSLEQALNEQMRRAPQTDVNGRWVNASRTQVEKYVNPENFIRDLNILNVEVERTGRVNVSALNVRSGGSTNHSILGVVHQGQELGIIESQNGWLKVTYSVGDTLATGWVSASFVDIINEKSLLTEFTDAFHPTAQVDVSLLNVRSGPGTTHGIVTQISRNSRYTILMERNGWYQIQLGNDKTGWVSGSLVNVSNRIDRNLLQFLILSGSSGISANELNQELRNSGILTGTGNAFIEASRQYNINEIYLMAHAKLETGNGTSRLATGILVDEVDGEAVPPKVVYNMYGIAAFDNSPLKSGSEYAYKMGWDTPEKSIIGGAEWISRQYVNHPTHKQDTLYKMRWNPSNPGAHQYATDIGWAVKQTSSLNTLVELSQKYDLTLQFDIPVYKK